MRRERYFSELYSRLEDENFLPVRDSHWRSGFQESYEAAGIPDEIISCLHREYGNVFNNILLVNCRKSLLLRKIFSNTVDMTLMHTSVLFTLLGCILDYLIDCGNEEQQSYAAAMLDEKYIDSYFGSRNSACSDTCIDLIYEQLSAGFEHIRCIAPDRADKLIKMIAAAASAEINVKKQDCPNQALLSKSVMFTEISGGILLCDLDDTTAADKLISAVGCAYALMDDMCDVFEDREIGQHNLVNRMTGNETERISSVIDLLKEKINYIKCNASPTYYELILNELREWTLSCRELREHYWSCYG